MPLLELGGESPRPILDGPLDRCDLDLKLGTTRERVERQLRSRELTCVQSVNRGVSQNVAERPGTIYPRLGESWVRAAGFFFRVSNEDEVGRRLGCRFGPASDGTDTC